MVKLKSNREVELKPLTFLQKQTIKDIAFTFHSEKIFPVMTTWTKALMMIGLKEEELEQWTDEEIAEAGNWVLENSGLNETQKKN